MKMTFFLRILALVSGLNLAGAHFAFAGAIAGTILNDGKSPLQLVLKDTQSPVLIEARLPLLAYLHRFRTGDFVSAQGTINGDAKKVFIDAVDRVGLQELLGAWRSSRWEIFEFEDYNRLNLYVPTSGGSGPVSLNRIQSLNYVVTPDQNNRYSIFMSDQSDVRMGFLEIGQNRLTLSVTDFKTGKVTENISLSPIRLQ